MRYEGRWLQRIEARSVQKTHLTSFDAKAAPMVVFIWSVNWSFVKRTTILDFPEAAGTAVWND